jgi:hypothetical protein
VVWITKPAADEIREDCIRIVFTAGYPAYESATLTLPGAYNIPQGIRLAMLWIIGAAYAQREEGKAVIDSTVERLLNKYKAWRVGA